MSSLSSHEEYQAIAASMTLPSNAYVDGKFIPAKSGDTFESINPANGKLLAKISACGDADIDFAVLKAREAFDDGRWHKLHPSERKQVLIKLCKLIKRNQKELAVMESLESGKPIADIEQIDMADTIHCIQWYAEAIDKIYDQIAPSGDDVAAMIIREPVGVVGCVLPWNFPLLMIAWKLAPALAAGNSIIIKPAEETTMTALRIAELAHAAGVPAGVFNVVTGLGETAGKALGLHNDVDMISFTGSTQIGRRFLEYSAQSNLKKVVLECGGKNPCVVMDDAEDLDIVAQHVTNGAFWNMGENCSANSRLLVDERIADALLECVLHRLRDWRTGDPLHPSNRLGAIVSQKQYEMVLGYIEAGKKEGAKLVAGGNAIELDNGYYIEPTIFTDVKPEMTIATEEIFGPVLAVITFNNESQAVQIANDTDYGLSASVFTSNLKRAHRVARMIRAGTVSVNCVGEGDITTPFGGYKRSGFGGRDKSLQAFDQYTETKTIWIDLSDQVVDDSIE